MEEFFRIIIENFGLTGVILVIFSYQVFYLQRQLTSTIHNNTAAMAKTAEVLDNMREIVLDCKSRRAP
jgi:hypothetical protein